MDESAEMHKQGIKNMEDREGITAGTPLHKLTKESIMESIEATTQEMVVIATLKEAIANYLLLDDYVNDYYEEERSIPLISTLLGRLELSLIRRKQMLNEDQKALLEL